MTPGPYGRPRSKSRARRIVLVMAATMVALVVNAGHAAAHTELISTTPADQQTVSRTPEVVILTFDEAVLAIGTQVVVTGPQGQAQVGAPAVAESRVSQNLQGGSPAGHYTVAWRVTAADGHPLSGTFSFTAEAANKGGPASVGASEARSSGETAGTTRASIWIWLLVGVAALAVVGVVTRRLTRRTDLSPRS